jgi:hypothetical protein
MNCPGEEHVKSRSYIFQESILSSETYLGKRKTYSEICYIFGPNAYFQILFVLLEITHFMATDGNENGKLIKIHLTRSSPGPVI